MSSEVQAPFNIWKTFNLLTATPTVRIGPPFLFTVFVDGTFGGGTVRFHPIDSVTKAASTGFIAQLDGTTKSATLPPGAYQVTLNGSTGGNVLVYYTMNIQGNRDC